jgi:hypothetical protein
MLREGDTPQKVAQHVYGDSLKYQTLLRANPLCTWEAGGIVEVPNRKGRLAELREAESRDDLLHRMFPGQMYQLYRHYYEVWNLPVEELSAGTLVFVPERQ